MYLLILDLWKKLRLFSPIEIRDPRTCPVTPTQMNLKAGKLCRNGKTTSLNLTGNKMLNY